MTPTQQQIERLMNEPKQREEFKATQNWTVLSLVFDFDADHPKSHGVNKYGAWTVRTVKDEKGIEYSFFTSGNLMSLLDHLEINKKGNRFQIRKQATIDEKTDKPYSFFEIRTANGEFNTKVGATPETNGKEKVPVPESKQENPPPPNRVDDAIATVGEVITKYIRELKKIEKNEELQEGAWEKLYSPTHISTILINLSK